MGECRKFFGIWDFLQEETTINAGIVFNTPVSFLPVLKKMLLPYGKGFFLLPNKTVWVGFLRDKEIYKQLNQLVGSNQYFVFDFPMQEEEFMFFLRLEEKKIGLKDFEKSPVVSNKKDFQGYFLKLFSSDIALLEKINFDAVLLMEIPLKENIVDFVLKHKNKFSAKITFLFSSGAVFSDENLFKSAKKKLKDIGFNVGVSFADFLRECQLEKMKIDTVLVPFSTADGQNLKSFQVVSVGVDSAEAFIEGSKFSSLLIGEYPTQLVQQKNFKNCPFSKGCSPAFCMKFAFKAGCLQGESNEAV